MDSLWIVIGGVGGLASIFLFFVWLFNRPKRTKHGPATETPERLDMLPPPTPVVSADQLPKPSDRVYIMEKPQELLEMFEGKTDMQADGIVRPYIGKWMRIEGEVSNVSSRSSFDSISLETEEVKFGHIHLLFSKERWHEKLEIVRLGYSIVADGVIEEIGRHTLRLEDCEIVTVSPRKTSSDC